MADELSLLMFNILSLFDDTGIDMDVMEEEQDFLGIRCKSILSGKGICMKALMLVEVLFEMIYN